MLFFKKKKKVRGGTAIMSFKIHIKTIKVIETDPDFLQQKSSYIISFCIFSQWD